VVTLLISFASYRFLETPFLGMKSLFMPKPTETPAPIERLAA
jgi:hypothetical protein